jgi:cytochrome c
VIAGGVARHDIHTFVKALKPVKLSFASITILSGLVAVPAASAQSSLGEQTFRQRCQACHTVAPDGKPGPIGPNLRGVVGRKAASTVFATYSPALKAAKITWSKATLDKFLTAPGQLVPGTRMVVSIADPKQRADLIAYLMTLR